MTKKTPQNDTVSRDFEKSGETIVFHQILKSPPLEPRSEGRPTSKMSKK